MKIYTRRGDDGTTGLLFGGRVAKDSELPSAYGAVDEAQAALGLCRASAGRGGELDRRLVALEADLWVLMAELATDPANRAKLTAGKNLVTKDMVAALEDRIDELSARFDPPTEFVVPGETVGGAQLDVARTVVRRAERDVLRAHAALAARGTPVEGSEVVAYLNRLSDLLWTMARWQEGESLTARSSRGPGATDLTDNTDDEGAEG
jgi:cob(I)alamin adenosyltransferase